jgi:hypothetical protein
MRARMAHDLTVARMTGKLSRAECMVLLEAANVVLALRAVEPYLFPDDEDAATLRAGAYKLVQTLIAPWPERALLHSP